MTLQIRAMTIQSVRPMLQQHHALSSQTAVPTGQHERHSGCDLLFLPRTETNRTSLPCSSSPQPPAHSPQPTAQPLNVSIPARCQKERSSAALLKVKRLRPSSPSAGKNTFFYDCCCPAGALGSSTFRNADVAFVTAVRMKTTVL